jgi:hypothetical protein
MNRAELSYKVIIMTIESNIRRKLENIKNNSIDLDFSPENMYLWGFIWADGYLHPNISRVALEITKDDFVDIQSIIPFYYNLYERNRKNRKPQSSAISTREDFYTFLKNLGYTEKEKPNDTLLKNKNSFYWFRGLIDGDGSWYIKNYTKQFCIASNYYQDWVFFEDMLNFIEVSKYSIRRVVQKSGKYSVLRITNISDLKKLVNYLYPQNSLDIGLKRKSFKANLIKET